MVFRVDQVSFDFEPSPHRSRLSLRLKGAMSDEKNETLETTEPADAADAADDTVDG